MVIEPGYCQCGCGQKTKVAERSNSTKGHIKGEHYRFIKCHHYHNGTSKNDYLRIRIDKGKFKREHIVRAEKAFGETLPQGAEVHHVNCTKHGGELVICQDRKYHALLHQRQDALNACGHADWRKCVVCKQYDSTDNLKIYKDKNPYYASRAYHLECKRQYESIGRERRRADKMSERVK